MTDLHAVRTPELRRELVEHTRTQHAADTYTLMIRAGRQPIRPAGHPDQVGRLLAATEAGRLARADLWHVDADLADLVDAAYPTMPAFAAHAHDLPGRHGFVTFGRPLTAMVRDAIPADLAYAEMLAADTAGNRRPRDAEAMREVLVRVTTDPVGIVAVSWGPVEESALAGDAHRWPAGATWMSFYSMPASVRSPGILDRLDPATAAAIRASRPALTVDNELVIGWHPEGTDPEPWLIGPTGGGTAAWGAAVLTAFLLARQGNVADQVDEPVCRPERRRHTRAGLPEPGPVRVLRLRRSVRDRVSADAGGPGRTYKVRWVVRGHWRNQWYPSIGAHRPKWISPYLAGPDDAPLLGGDKVTRVSAPPSSSQEVPRG